MKMTKRWVWPTSDNRMTHDHCDNMQSALCTYVCNAKWWSVLSTMNFINAISFAAKCNIFWIACHNCVNLTFDICANRRNILRIVSLFAWCRRYHRHHRHRVHHLPYTQNLFCTNSILQLFINIKLYESEKERERVQLSRRRCIRKYVRFLSYWCIPSSQQHMHSAHSFFTLFDLKWISTCWHDTCTYVSVRKWTNRRKKRWNCRQLIYALLAILCTQNTVLLHSINILWSTNIFTLHFSYALQLQNHIFIQHVVWRQCGCSSAYYRCSVKFGTSFWWTVMTLAIQFATLYLC